jgi:DNA-binding IclR family transcriptional regulator
MSNTPDAHASVYDPSVPAIDQTMRILQFLTESSPAPKKLTEICRKAGIHKSRGYALLRTLQKYDVVIRDHGTKTYRIGPGLLPLGKTFLDHLDLRQISQPVMTELSQTTHSTVLLGHIHDESVFVIGVSEGKKDLGISIRVGHRFDLTYGAHGKAIVAFTPFEERQRILRKRPHYFYGDPNKPDAQRLAIELNECRQKGYAVDLGELEAGITAISAPISGPGEHLIGCLILVGLISEEEVDADGRMVVEGAIKITRAAGGSLHTPER